MISPNGAKPHVSERGLRWIWFGGSIISDWNNPIATTNRAVIQSLQHRGHRVVYIEPNDHPAFMESLKSRGSAIYRAFQEVYPDIHYRRESIPGGSEGDVWLSRETALSDVLMVQDDAPAKVFDWLERIPASPIVRILLAQNDVLAEVRSRFDVVLSPDGDDSAPNYGPCVLPGEGAAGVARVGTLSVVYEGAGPGAEDAGTSEVLAAGAGAPDELPFLPEARLPDRYRAVERVVIYEDSSSPFAAARAMLAAASGADVSVVRANAAPRTVEALNDASEQAGRIIDQVMKVRARRQHAEERREP